MCVWFVLGFVLVFFGGVSFVVVVVLVDFVVCFVGWFGVF